MLKHNNDNSTGLNVASLLSVLVILLFGFTARRGLEQLVENTEYLYIFGLSGLIIVLPSLVSRIFSNNNNWIFSESLITVFLLMALGLLGYVVGDVSNVYLKNGIFATGLISVMVQIFLFVRESQFMTSTMASITFLFIVAIYHAQEFHSVVSYERMVLGRAYIDTLFFSSLNNMISTFGWSTTGIDGNTYFKYHWGAHAMFVGLKNLINQNSINFYSLTYPAIFIPVYLKSFIHFVDKIRVFKKFDSGSSVFVFAFLSVIYSVGFSGSGPTEGAPFIGESLCFSLVVTFAMATIILDHSITNTPPSGFFLGTCIFLLLVLTFSKISTAIIVLVALCYLYLRYSFSVRRLITAFLAFLLICGVGYVVVYPEARSVTSINFNGKVINMWQFSDGFATYLFAMCFASSILLKKVDLSSLSNMVKYFRSKQFLDLEILLVINIVGLAGAVFTAGFSYDVYTFLAVQLFVALAFATVYLNKWIDGFQTQGRTLQIAFLLIIVLSVVSRPDIFFDVLDFKRVKTETLHLTKKQQILKEYIGALHGLEREPNKQNKTIFVPPTENWLYKSQYMDIGSAMLTPAVSGIAMVGGVSDSLYNSDLNYYSLYYFRKQGLSAIQNIDQAIERANKLGFKELIYFREIDGRLKMDSYKLNSL